LVLNDRVLGIYRALEQHHAEHKSRNGVNGKQYVAVTAATQGQGKNGSLHVFMLP